MITLQRISEKLILKENFHSQGREKYITLLWISEELILKVGYRIKLVQESALWGASYIRCAE
jgi:hypothetical protein